MSKKYFSKLIQIIDFLSQIMLVLFTIIVFVNVIGRYFFSNTILWTEQISGFLFIWMSFFGLIIVTYRKQHLVVDIFVSRFPNFTKKLIIIIGNILSIVFLTLLGISGILILPNMLKHIDPPLMIPLGYAYTVIPLFSFLTVIILIGQSYNLIYSLSKRQKNNIDNRER